MTATTNHVKAVELDDTMLNADEIFAEVSKTRAYLPALPVDRESLLRYALASEYNSQTKSFFESGEISVADEILLDLAQPIG